MIEQGSEIQNPEDERLPLDDAIRQANVIERDQMGQRVDNISREELALNSMVKATSDICNNYYHHLDSFIVRDHDVKEKGMKRDTIESGYNKLVGLKKMLEQHIGLIGQELKYFDQSPAVELSPIDRIREELKNQE